MGEINKMEKIGRIKEMKKMEKVKKIGEDYQENKVNLGIRENSSSKVSVYHHIINNY